jgi:hypothetical protein
MKNMLKALKLYAQKMQAIKNTLAKTKAEKEDEKRKEQNRKLLIAIDMVGQIKNGEVSEAAVIIQRELCKMLFNNSR